MRTSSSAYADRLTPTTVNRFERVSCALDNAVRVLREAAFALTLAVGSAMKTTDPPVKVLLADGFDETGAGTVEQQPLIHHLPFISLLHLPFLPRIPGEKCVLETEGTYRPIRAT